MAGQPLPRKKEQLAAVQRGNGQQVEDAHIDRQQSHQGKHIPPAVPHSLPDYCPL